MLQEGLMSSTRNEPYFVLSAVKRIYDELPTLMGKTDWAKSKQLVDNNIAELEATSDAYIISTKLFILLSNYEEVRKKLVHELHIQTIIWDKLHKNLRHIAAELGIEADAIDSLVAASFDKVKWDVISNSTKEFDNTNRMPISVSDGGKQASLITFRNLKVNFWDVTTLSAAFVTTGFNVAVTPYPIFVIASIILLVRLAGDFAKVETTIEAQDASVLWGVITAIGDTTNAGVSTSTIAKVTILERAKYNIEPAFLSEKQVNASLEVLKKLNCVQERDNYYYLIETYNIKE